MAFTGTFLKINGTSLDKYIERESLEITPNQRTDVDSYVDANGKLHRTVATHTRTKIEFNTKVMGQSDLMAFMNLFKNNYINTKERQIIITYYDGENDAMKDGTFYVPDFTFIPSVKRGDSDVLYKAQRFAFIEY